MTDQAERDAYKSANDGEDLPQTYDEWLEVDIDRYERICQHFHPAGRQSLRHRLPVVEGLRLRFLLCLPLHVLHRR